MGVPGGRVRGRSVVRVHVAAVGLALCTLVATAATAAPSGREHAEPVRANSAPSTGAGANQERALPQWYDETRVQADTTFPPDSYWGRPEFDQAARLMKDLGARAVNRRVVSRDEDPWWPSDVPRGEHGERLFDGDRINRFTHPRLGVAERFVPAGTDLAQEMADEADREDMPLIVYNNYELDRRLAEAHPEWLCRKGDRTINDPFRSLGLPIDITIPEYRDVVAQRLVELAERGVEAIYFDRNISPHGGCISHAAAARYEAETGNQPPTPEQFPQHGEIPDDIDWSEYPGEEGGYGDLLSLPPRWVADSFHPAYMDWVQWRIDNIRQTLELWDSAVKATDPGVMLIVSMTELPGITGVLGSSTWPGVVDAVKTEYTNGSRSYLQNFIFQRKDNLLRPDHDISQALGFSVLRDTSDGRPPHSWSGISLPNADHALQWAASVITYGGIASLDVWRDYMFDDPVGASRPFTPVPAMRDVFTLGRRISPALSHTRPLRWAALHYSESQRNDRYVMEDGVERAWREVLWPLVGAFQSLTEAGVPTGVVTDQQLTAGGLDDYELLFLPQRDELTAEQAAAVLEFEAGGGVVIENDPAWNWSQPDHHAAAVAAFNSAVSGHLSDAPVRVTGGPTKLHAGAYALPAAAQGQTSSSGRLVVTISNDFGWVQNPTNPIDPADVNAPAPPASGVEVAWDRDQAFPGAAGAGLPIRVYDAVSGETLNPTPTPRGYKVTLPDFDHLAVLVVEHDPPGPADDDEAPWVFGTQAAPGDMVVGEGEPITITAYADDNGQGGGTISSASYIVDAGPPSPMQPADGQFDRRYEKAVAEIPAFTEPGEHSICVTASDQAGNASEADECTHVLVEEQPVGPTSAMTGSDTRSGDEFGTAIAIDEDFAVVGARRDDDAGSNSGSAYVFHRDGEGNWTEQAKLVASDGSNVDQFGSAVALDGGTALIGAASDDGVGSNSGSAYVFTRQTDGTWVESAKLTASDAAEGDQFGTSVAVTGDTAFVGARFTDDKGSDAGSVYIFERQPDGSWVQQHEITAEDGATEDYFGWSVAADDGVLVVGAPFVDDAGDSTGAAYLFERSAGGGWLLRDKLVSRDRAPGDTFGRAVAIDADALAIGAQLQDEKGLSAGSVYMFANDGNGQWVQQDKLTPFNPARGDEFGSAVALVTDTLLAGAPQRDGVGSAYVFKQTGNGSWAERARLVAPSGPGSLLGSAVALHHSGTAIVSGPLNDDRGDDAGSAFTFDLVGAGG